MRVTEPQTRQMATVEPASKVSKVTSTEGTQPARGTDAVSSNEKVTVSSEARKLADAASSKQGTDRIEKLRAAIQSGTFRVDTHAIAARIVGTGED